jgi:hypothetical protein
MPFLKLKKKGYKPLPFYLDKCSIPHIIKRYEISKGMRVSESDDSVQTSSLPYP